MTDRQLSEPQGLVPLQPKRADIQKRVLENVPRIRKSLFGNPENGPTRPNALDRSG